MEAGKLQMMIDWQYEKYSQEREKILKYIEENPQTIGKLGELSDVKHKMMALEPFITAVRQKANEDQEILREYNIAIEKIRTVAERKMKQLLEEETRITRKWLKEPSNEVLEQRKRISNEIGTISAYTKKGFEGHWVNGDLDRLSRLMRK